MKKLIFVLLLAGTFSSGINLVSAAGPTITSANSSGVTQTTATLNGVVNPQGSTVNVWYQDSTGTTLPGSQVNGLSGASDITLPPFSLSGLTAGTSYTYKLVATDGPNIASQDISFSTPPAPVAFIVSSSATGVTQTAATLNGTVNPNGTTINVWYQDKNGVTVPGSQVNGITGVTNVTLPPFTLSGLTANTSYTYKLVETDGPNISSANIVFSTLAIVPPPVAFIVSSSATGVTQTAATLNGTVNPNGTTINVWYQDKNGVTVPGSQVNGITGVANVTLPPFSLSGLTQNTSYTYKLVETDGPNISSSNISFMTLPVVPPPPSAPTLTSLAPNNGTQGQTFNVTLTGTNFIAGSTASFSGAGITVNSTTINNAASITANISISAVAAIGGSNVTVTNANGTSGAQTFTVNALIVGGGGGGNGGGGSGGCMAINISSISPTSVIAGGNATLVTINGSNFFNGISSTFYNGNTKPTTFVNSNKVTFNLLTSDIATTGSASVFVTNGNGCNSNTVTLLINHSDVPIIPVSTNPPVINPIKKVPVVDPIKTATPKTIKNNVTVTSNQSDIRAEIDYANIPTAELKIVNTNTSDKLSIGDAVTYSVSFKNIFNKNLENTKISVQLPKEIDFIESSLGVMGDNNLISFDAGTLIQNESGTLTIKGKVNSGATVNTSLVTTATMSYIVTGSTITKTETSYATNSVVSTNSVTGLEANSFLGFGLVSHYISWPVLLLIILGLILLARRILRQS